jgi:hypothetical protein
VFEYFTDPAKQAIVTSQDEAIAMGHDFIGTEHMLLGLVATRDTAGAVLRDHGVELARARDAAVRLSQAAGIPTTGVQDAKDALSAIGIDVGEIQQRADETFGPGAFRFPRPAYTPRAKTVLELTLREAKDLGHEHIGTEHMLLGMLAEGEGHGVQVLKALDVDVDALRSALRTRVAA